MALPAGPPPSMAAKDDAGREKAAVWLGFTALALCYLDRLNMTLLLPTMARDLQWDTNAQAGVLNAFFGGYLLTQVVGGHLANRQGGAWVLARAVVLWSAATAAVAVVADLGVASVVACRFALGIAEGVTFPAAFALLAEHVPEAQRTKAAATMLLGAHVGTIVGTVAVPASARAMGWHLSFVAMGLLGAVWLVVQRGWTAALPAPSGNSRGARVHGGGVPWKRLVAAPALIGIACAHVGNNFSFYLVFSWLPSFFVDELNVPADRLDVTLFPYVAQALAIVASGHIAEWLTQRRRWSVARMRRTMTVVASVGAAAALQAMAQSTTPVPGIAASSLFLMLRAQSTVGYNINHLDIASPELVGACQAVTNTVATLGGLVGVPFVAFVKERGGGWPHIAAACALVDLTGCCTWLALARFDIHLVEGGDM